MIILTVRNFVMMWRGQQLTKEQAYKRIRQYCAYQERCHNEVKETLYSYGLRRSDVDSLISTLIEDNFLNEERFAVQFAGGKFRIKHWGRKKIQYELQQKGVSRYNIELALKQIDTNEYEQTLRKLAETKWQSLAGEHFLTRSAKTHSYLMQKGFEPVSINQIISDIRAAGKNH